MKELKAKCNDFILKIYNYKQPKNPGLKALHLQVMSNKNKMLLVKLVDIVDAFITGKKRELPEIDEIEVELFNEGTRMKLLVHSTQLKQNLAREMFTKYGFGVFEVEFELALEKPEFVITKLKDGAAVIKEMDNQGKVSHVPKTRFFSNEEKKATEQLTTRIEALSLEDQIKCEADSLFQYELGFSRVIELMIKSKKPLVGHNMFLDVMFLYDHFIADLPPTLKQFIHNFQWYFPVIYDTKAMAENTGLFNQTTLVAMSNKCFTEVKFKNYLEFEYDLHMGFRKYMSK